MIRSACWRADIVVVSIEQAVDAPFATRHLADLGARVIKIERPVSGDFARAYDSTVNGMASHFVWHARHWIRARFVRGSIARKSRTRDSTLSRISLLIRSSKPGPDGGRLNRQSVRSVRSCPRKFRTVCMA
jgi:itaconate CoA-transferase